MIDFDKARNNEMCFYGASSGEKLKFKWTEQHNLYEFGNDNVRDYDRCDFSNSTKHADAGPNEEGVLITID